MKICLCRQVFVCVETSRLHLEWSDVDRNLTFFGYQNKLVPILSHLLPGPWPLKNLVISWTGMIVFSEKYIFAMVRWFSSLMVFARSVPINIICITCSSQKRIKSKPFIFAQIFQFVNTSLKVSSTVYGEYCLLFKTILGISIKILVEVVFSFNTKEIASGYL